MATLATETWTGSNGSAWPAQWTTGQTGTGSAATIQSNRGRLASGTQGAYSSAGRISRRLNITAPTNVEVSGTWTPDTNEPYAAVGVRADNLIDTGDGYYLLLNKSGTLEVVRFISYTGTSLGTFSFSASSSTTYGFRLSAVGSSIKARVWSGTEPSTWNINTTDTGVTGSGAVGFTVVCGNAAVAHAVDFDDLVVTDGANSADVAAATTFTASPSATVSSSTVTLATETWTGSNGAAWPAQWVIGQTGTGSAATIQSNKGRLASGTQGANSGASRISRRLNITAPQDAEISGTWTPDANEPYAIVTVRADNAVDTQTGYILELNKSGTLNVKVAVAYTQTTIGVITFAASSSTTYGFRLRVVGSSIKARVWSGTEPSTWQVDTTNTTVTAAGAVGLSVVAGNSTAAHGVDFDDLVVTNGTSGGQVSATSTFGVNATTVTTWQAQVARATVFGVTASAGQAHTAAVTAPFAFGSASAITVIPRMFTALRIWILWNGITWTEVSSLVHGPATIRQGRATEFEDVGPAVLTLTLDNVDGELMPDNPASPHYPNVTIDKRILVVAERGPQSWVRFSGWIKSIEPEFPRPSAYQSVVKLTAVDALGLCAARRLQSCWVLGAAYKARQAGTRWDAFVLDGSGRSTSYCDNVTTSPGEKARAVIVPWSSIDVGPPQFGEADGLSIDGAATLQQDSLGQGCHIRVHNPNTTRCLQFWLRVPSELQLDATNFPSRDVVQFGPADPPSGTAENTLSLVLNGATQTDLNMYSPVGAFLGTVAAGVATDQWVRVSFLTKSSTPTTTDCYYDGGGTAGGGFVNVAMDLRNHHYFRFGGIGQNVGKFSVAGISLAGLETAVIPVENGLAAGDAGDIGNRVASWSYTVPGAVAATTGTVTGDDAATGIWHGRTSLEVGQEIARTARGVIWVQPATGAPRLYAADACYPVAPLAVIDTEGDLISTPQLRVGSESRPTRVTVEFPGGSETVIDAAAEVASQITTDPDSGQVRTATVSTIARTYVQAGIIGQEILDRAGLGMRITSLTIDLEQSATDLVATLLDQSQPTSGLYPTQRLQVAVPASHFGVATKDVYVQGWEEVYDPDRGATIKLDLSPAFPPPGPVPTSVAAAHAFLATATVTGAGGGAPGSLAVAKFGTPASGKQWHSGAWESIMAADRATRWGTWRGRTADCVTVYPAYATWAEIQGSTWVTTLLAGFTGFMNYGLPMLPSNRPGAFTDVTSGANDAVFLAVANDLASNGRSGSAIRVGIESNGDWFAWGITAANLTQWQAAFRRIVDLFRSVSSNFKFGLDWSAGFKVPGLSTSLTPAQVWDTINPGDTYWDFLGIDTYDHDEIKVTSGSDSSWQNHLRPSTGGAGIGNAIDWIRTKTGKGLALPEWGVTTYNGSSRGNGDNPYYITRMHEFLTSCTDRLLYECYFNEPFANVYNSMWTEFGDPQQVPNSGTEYKRLFGNVTPPPSGGGGGVTGSYPTQNVAVYKKIWSVDSAVTAVPSNATEIRLAFGQGTPPSLVGYTSAGQSSFMAALAARRAAGQRVILSLGGAGGAIDISQRSSILSGVASIKAQLVAGGADLDGIDWDLEGSATLGSADAVAISTSLKTSYGAGFAILMAPNGSNQSQYRTAAAAMHSAGCLDAIGQQYYDAPVSLSAAKSNIDLYIAAGIPASKVSVGMMIGNDSNHWTLQQCTQYMQDIRNTYGITRCYLWMENNQSADAVSWVTSMRTIVGI